MKRIATIALLCLPLAAAAQTVHRCEAEGRVSYGDAPCAGGRAVDVDDRRPAADVQAARDAAARERDLAEQLRSERLRRQAAAAVRPAAMDRRTEKPAQQLSKPLQPPAARSTSRAAAPSIRRARG